MRAYLINLDDSTARLKLMEEVLRPLPLQVERIAAVDTRGWSVREMEPYLVEGMAPKLRPGDVGAFLSHQLCWERIAEGPDERTLVLEDDMVAAVCAVDVLASLTDGPDGADIIRLQRVTEEYLWADRRTVQAIGRGHRLARLRSPTWESGAYIVTRDTARRLLATGPPWPKSVDGMIFRDLLDEIAIYALFPGIFIQRQFVASEDDTGAATSTMGPLLPTPVPSLSKRFRNAVRRLVAGQWRFRAHERDPHYWRLD